MTHEAVTLSVINCKLRICAVTHLSLALHLTLPHRNAIAGRLAETNSAASKARARSLGAWQKFHRAKGLLGSEVLHRSSRGCQDSQPELNNADCLHACQHLPSSHAAGSHEVQPGLTAGLQLLQDVLPQKFGVLFGHLARTRQQSLQRSALARSRSTNEACRRMQSMFGSAGSLWTHNFAAAGCRCADGMNKVYDQRQEECCSDLHSLQPAMIQHLQLTCKRHSLLPDGAVRRRLCLPRYGPQCSSARSAGAVQKPCAPTGEPCLRAPR